MKGSDRRPEHRKVQELERLFEELKGPLSKAERDLEDREAPEAPPVFILGCARSGSTLVHQYLASSGLFAYPSNVISRFFYAPLVGAKVQKMLFELDDQGEVFPDKRAFAFDSDLGKSKGPLAPHEFWYFWRRFFPFGELHKVDRDRLKEEDLERLVKELGNLEGAFRKPLLMKAMILHWDLDILERVFPNALFVQVKRDPKANARSLLHARQRFYGDHETWYSFKPPVEYPELKDKDPVEQVLGQVRANERTVERFFADLPSSRTLCLPYEDFCRSPYPYLEELSNRIRGRDPSDLCPKELQDLSFEVSDGGTLSDEMEARLEEG